MNRGYMLPLAALGLLVATFAPLGPAGAVVDELTAGLKIGQSIPDDFAVEDETGKSRDFASLRGENGLILLFTRSLDW